MTATDELRRMLDERGAEWGNVRNDGSESDYLTEWQFEENQGKAIAIEWAVGSGLSVEVHRYRLTPEQAIAATLGPGTCRNNAPTYLDFLCSECGFVHYHSDANDTKDGNGWGYCPNCGRRVVEVGE